MNKSLKAGVFVGSLVPYTLLLIRGLRGTLGANPIAEVLNQLGLLALLFLIASLSCTPLKIVFGWKWPIAIRKMLGLFAFSTVFAHFFVYLVVDQRLALGALIADVGERPFIAVGFIAFVLLIPLAVTSTARALKRLGPKNWKRLHQLAYVIGILGVVHYLLRVKKDATEPIVYGSMLGLLFAVRIFDALRQRLRKAKRATAKSPA